MSQVTFPAPLAGATRLQRALPVLPNPFTAHPTPSPPPLPLQPLHELNSEPEAPLFEFGYERLEQRTGARQEGTQDARPAGHTGRLQGANCSGEAAAPACAPPPLLRNVVQPFAFGGSAARREAEQCELAHLRRLILEQCDRFRSLAVDSDTELWSSPAPRDHSPLLQTPTAVGSKRNLAQRGGRARAGDGTHDDDGEVVERAPRRAGRWKADVMTAAEPRGKPGGPRVTPLVAAASANAAVG